MLSYFIFDIILQLSSSVLIELDRVDNRVDAFLRRSCALVETLPLLDHAEGCSGLVGLEGVRPPDLEERFAELLYLGFAHFPALL